MKAILTYLFLSFFCVSALAEIKVGIVLDKGGKEDKSFNASAYKGLMKAKEDLKIFVKYVEASDDNSFEPMLKAFAEKDFDLIIAVGFSQKVAVKKVAAQFPKKHFAIVDAEVKEPNVRSLLFEEQEGSYLMGALAALNSKSDKIGYIGGMDIPQMRRFELGYKTGAQKINPKINVVSNFIGVTSEAWNNPAKSKELALGQYGGGVNIIFAVAGASNTGVFDAAEEKKALAIGVDSNQNGLKPGYILTSMLKRVDVAVFDTIKATQDGKFTGGVEHFGLNNGGIDYAMDDNNKKLISVEDIKKLEDLKKQIIAKKIQVPDYYKIKAIK